MVALGVIGLVFVWVCHFLAAAAILHQVGERRAGVVGAFGWALAMAGPALIGRLVPDFRLATGLSALGAVLCVAALWRTPPRAEPERLASIRTPFGLRFLQFVLFLLVCDASLEGFWWDEYSGHFGLTSVISHGILPPEFPLYPGRIFRYHYGFDVLAAQVRAFAGVSSGLALDVVSIVCFALLLFVSRDFGRRLGGRWGAALTPILLPLGSGTLQFLLFPDLGSIELRASWLPEQFGNGMPPPIISNFFQHPQGLAMPLALATLLLFDEKPPRRARIALGALLLGISSLAQVVFFGVLGLALGAQAIIRGLVRRDLRGMAIELGALSAALLIARIMGGFLISAETSLESLIVFGEGHFRGSWDSVLAQYFVVFGVPLISLPLIVSRVQRKNELLRWTLLITVVIGFLIPSLIRYERSWDIVKFYGVGGFFLNLLFADLMSGWMDRISNLSRTFRALEIGAITTTAVLATFSGLHFLVRMGPLDGRAGVPNMHFPPPSGIAEKAGRLLRSRMEHPRERVLIPYWHDGVSAGVLAPGHSWRVVGQTWMVDRTRLDRLHQHFKRALRNLRTEDLDALHIRWAVLAPNNVSGLSPEGRTNLETNFVPIGDVEHEGGTRRIFRRKLPRGDP